MRRIDNIVWNGSVFSRSTIQRACNIYAHESEHWVEKYLEGHARVICRVDQYINAVDSDQLRSKFNEEIKTRDDDSLIKYCYRFLSKIRKSSELVESFLWSNSLDIKEIDLIEQVLQEAVSKENKAFFLSSPKVLGECSNDKMLFLLQKNVDSFPPDRVWPAINGIRNIGSPLAIKYMRELSKSEFPEAWPLMMLFESLSLLGDCEAIPILKKFIEHDPSHDYRGAELYFNSAKALCRLDDESGFAALTGAMSLENDTHRTLASQSMYELGDIRFLPTICEALNDHDENMRILAVTFISKYDVNGIEKLEMMISDASWGVRQAVAGGFGYQRDAKTIGLLAKMLDDEDDAVQADAIWALSQIGDESALEIIHQATRHKNLLTRYQAQQSLEILGIESSHSILIDKLNERGPIITLPENAATALGDCGAYEAIPELVKKLTTCNCNMLKSAAIKSLAKLGNTDLIPLFEPFLFSSDEDLANSAILGLMFLGAEDLFRDYLHNNVFSKSLIGAIGLVSTGLVRGVCNFLEPPDFSQAKSWIAESEEGLFEPQKALPKTS